MISFFGTRHFCIGTGVRGFPAGVSSVHRSAMIFTAALPYGLMVTVKAFLRSRAFPVIMRYWPVSVCKVSSESNHRSCDNGYRCLLDPHLSLILSILVYQWTPFSLNQYVLVLLYVRLRCSWTGVSFAVSGRC